MVERLRFKTFEPLVHLALVIILGRETNPSNRCHAAFAAQRSSWS